MSSIKDASPQHRSSVTPAARVVPASGTITCVTTVTPFWRDSRPMVRTHARSPVPTVREAKEGALHVGESGDHDDEQDVIHLRVGMGSGVLSHSNFGAHLKATCVNRYPPTKDPVSTSAFLHIPGTGNKGPSTLPTLGSCHRLGVLTRVGPCPVTRGSSSENTARRRRGG